MHAIIISGYEKSARHEYHDADILLTNEECCLGAVLVQEVEQVVSIRGWAIVKS